MPLKSDEESLGAISIYATEVRAFDASEQHLLEELSNNLSYGIVALRTGAEGRRVEAARRRIEANLSALVESTSDMIWSVDTDYRLSTFNRALRQTIERNHCTRLALGMRAEELLPPATAAQWLEMYERALSEGAFRVEYSATYGRSLELAFNPIVQDGQKTGISVFAKDITDRKQAEAALLESEKEFRTLAELVSQLVWMCQPDGLNIYFNQRWVDYTGLSLEESLGRGWNTPFHPDDRQPAWDAWNHAVATGDTYRIECRLRSADGNYRWFLIRGVPLCDASRSIVKWFGTCTDIDDLKRAQEELHFSNEKLEQRVQERTAELVSPWPRTAFASTRKVRCGWPMPSTAD